MGMMNNWPSGWACMGFIFPKMPYKSNWDENVDHDFGAKRNSVGYFNICSKRDGTYGLLRCRSDRKSYPKAWVGYHLCRWYTGNTSCRPYCWLRYDDIIYLSSESGIPSVQYERLCLNVTVCVVYWWSFWVRYFYVPKSLATGSSGFWGKGVGGKFRV